MYRIDDPSASTTLPTPEAANTEGYWTEGSPGSGIPATLERASWFNMIQEELRAIVVAGGLTPSKTTYNQVLSAIQALFIKAGHGQCRLSITSATVITLKPFNGNNLIINGAVQQIPAAGVALSNAGLSATTMYYVYAAMVAGVMTLVTSVTGHSTAANGVETMTGDTSKTLVGMVYPNAAGQFQNSGQWLGVIGWFNRQSITCNIAQPSTALTTTSASFVQLSNSYTITFITWGLLDARSSGNGANSSAATIAYIVGIDSVSVGSANVNSAIGTANYSAALTTVLKTTLTEGVHFAVAAGKTNTGTASFSLDLEVSVDG